MTSEHVFMNSNILTILSLTHTAQNQSRLSCQCHPQVNKQTRKEPEQEGGGGYYSWTEVLYCCTLKCGLSLASDTMWTTKRLFNWTEVKQMSLMDSIR